MSSPSDPQDHHNSKNRRHFIRVRGSSELERKQAGQTPLRDEESRGRVMDSRRGLSRQSRQAARPTVNWMSGKTVGASLQEMLGGDFKSINFNDVENIKGDDGNSGKKGEELYNPNPDEYR